MHIHVHQASPDKCQQLFYFTLFNLFIFKEGGGKEKEREKNISVWLPLNHCSLTGDLACNPGMWPDWELNQQSFGSQVGTQSTELPQPGPLIVNIWLMFQSCTHLSFFWRMV